VQLFGFITKKFVTLHGHMNVKYTDILMGFSSNLSSKILCVDRSYAHSLLECHPNRRAIGTKVHFAKFLNWHVLFPSVTSSLLDLNILSAILFSNILNRLILFSLKKHTVSVQKEQISIY
jgi:hypothetical protein